MLNNNDISGGGGKVVPIACIRVGKMVAAKCNSYKQINKLDGTFHYPKIPANLVRSKGTPYFKSLELTGISEGMEKKQKVSLFKRIP